MFHGRIREPAFPHLGLFGITGVLALVQGRCDLHHGVGVQHIASQALGYGFGQYVTGEALEVAQQEVQVVLVVPRFVVVKLAEPFLGDTAILRVGDELALLFFRRDGGLAAVRLVQDQFALEDAELVVGDKLARLSAVYEQRPVNFFQPYRCMFTPIGACRHRIIVL